MATPYSQISGGTLPLPRVHIPTWFKTDVPSTNNDTCLDLNILLNDSGSNTIYSTSNISDSIDNPDTKILDLGGTNITNDTTNNNYRSNITIGSVPPRQGSIIAYSNATGTILSGTNSAHVLYFEHAILKSFNFVVEENHVIQRIQKLYRTLISAKNGNTLTTITSPSTTYDMPDTSSYRMVINSTNEPDAVVASGTTKLILVEGGH